MKNWQIALVAAGGALFTLLISGVLAVATALYAVPVLQAAGEPASESESSPGESEEPPPSAQPAEPGEDPAEPAGPGAADVDIADFGGLSGADEVFEVRVNDAYIDDDGTVTDGAGFSETAPEGMDYAVFNLHITNISAEPAAWDGFDHLATGASGDTYANDTDAEFAAADDYFPSETLNPGESVETDAIFAIPSGESLTEVELNSTYGVTPVTLVP
ncbi:hypothetical protein F4561_000882 [Lipingzhangella halophila]|uniref:DUF4352 domain-containing protein n=1 Tax=Lipingzhangella halophila TaxID=1783352 RepID=A0A7W7RDM4_9ACTN|nr:DUF4352 domain-containing protein [Lipingzhangella halophila]MBB4930062.1 hypothetical protein [Lipingzhangella halophila]